jgi:phospholipid/cholesterol/gamma-HCH transport system substrate-binding protein
MEKRSIETAVGLFVIIGLVCVGYLTIKLGKMELIGDNTYPLIARFGSVSGLKPGAQVELAGVQIGQVASIELDRSEQMALVTLKIQKDVTLSDDVIASISTAGLIGDKYIKLSPGGSDRTLKPGETITETESAVDIEQLISKYVFGSAENKEK